MHRILHRPFFKVLTLLLLDFIIFASAQTQQGVTISEEFENFLEDLGSMVYKKKPSLHGMIKSATTTNSQKYRKKSELLEESEKEVLSDVLMMKLVSYYEEKYKLTQHESSTTEGFYSQFSASDFNEGDVFNARRNIPEQRNKMEQDLRRSYTEAIPDVVVL